MQPDDVLNFWFGAPDDPAFGKSRPLWFTKSDATDDVIRERFSGTVESALRGDLAYWSDTPRGTVALILLLDQFTRNIFRNTPRAFEGDGEALRLASRLVDRGADRSLTLVERWFTYMPFEHSEFLNDQHESVRLFKQLADEGMSEPLSWGIKHYDVIDRFGRFPHRNETLGRESTPEEIEFLKEQGSRF